MTDTVKTPAAPSLDGARLNATYLTGLLEAFARDAEYEGFTRPYATPNYREAMEHSAAQLRALASALPSLLRAQEGRDRDEIDPALTPALTPEEWRFIQRDMPISRDDFVAGPTGGEFVLRVDAPDSFIGRNDRHALAALCLDGMPFGFTFEDVALLERLAVEVEMGGLGEKWEASTPALRSLASRLRALLPPEQP